MGRNQRADVVFEKVEILDAGSEGKAIARVDNRVIFVPFVIPGDIVDIQVTLKRRSFLEGKAVRFHRYSEKRTDPFCTHFGVCGGCRWQNMRYEEQLYYKQKQVGDNLRRIGKIEHPSILPILPSPNIIQYRNKLEFTFSNRRWFTDGPVKENVAEKDRNALGFHIPAIFDKVLDIERCFLQEDPSNDIRLFVKDYALRHNMSFYDVRKWEGLMRNLIIRNSTLGDLMVIVVFRDDDRERITGLLDETAAAFPSITSLNFVINPKKNDVIADLPVSLYKGLPYIMESIPSFLPGGKDIAFRIGPVSFYQTNSRQAVFLYRALAGMAAFTGNETVYDLYSGAGTIANYIAPYVKEVIGIESIRAAVEDACVNTQLNGTRNARFHFGEVENLMNPGFMERNGYPDVIITDPPRSGMHEKAIRAILSSRAGKVIYVSCNPATQARDMAILADKYELIHSQPVDMFPHTHHVENVALLMRKDQSVILHDESQETI